MPDSQTDPEPLWTFRQHEIKTSDFNTAMVHFYRAEIQRSNVWRQRLDTTTNWAIITAGAAISFSLAGSDHHHGVIIINFVLVALFLYIEARRDRYFELLAFRTRLMERNFFAAMLVPPHAPAPDWAESLAASLRKPRFPISIWEALGRRFRRNYSWIFLTLAASWILKNITEPTAISTWDEFAPRAAIGPISGEVVIVVMGAFMLFLFGMGIVTIPLRKSVGEVFSDSRFDRFINERAANGKAD
ncbi:MAG: DUF2270 domain-containing protein [Chloroflexota bacterium]|nr:DUF2270 domain-containing protein [Chloroflexota bacterium]